VPSVGTQSVKKYDLITAQTTAGSRIASIDIMRGLVIVLTMPTHVRERFYMHTRTGDPIGENIEPDLFFTRMITHLCAPLFVVLAGTGAWLYGNAKEGRLPHTSRISLHACAWARDHCAGGRAVSLGPA